MKLSTQDKIKIMQHYVNGGALEVRYYDEAPNNWYDVIGEPDWNWEMLEWRVKDV